jgi:hypothetical protein
VLQEAFKEITVPAPTVALLQHYVVDVTKPTIVIRNEYAFKLVAEKDGQKSETIMPLKTGAFMSTVNFGLSRDTSSNTEAYNTIRLTVSTRDTTVQDEKFTLEIYRRKQTEPEGMFTKIKTEENFVPSNGPYSYDDTTGLVQNTAYVYRVVVKQQGTVFENEGTDEADNGGNGYTPALPAAGSFSISNDTNSILTIVSGVTIPAKSLYFNAGSSPVNGLDGAPVTLRIGGITSSTTVGVRTYQGQYYYFITVPNNTPSRATVEYRLPSDSYNSYTITGW